MPGSHKIIYAVYFIIWTIMAIDPKYPPDWLLENVLVFIFFPLTIWLDRKYHFTSTSLIFLLVFASLHSLGAHYTYAEMEWFDAITYFFGFERNHFDRLVHFLFGLLAFRAFFEMVSYRTLTVGSALLFTATAIISISALYEIVEWLAAIIFHPELGLAFLGTQGDVWDAEKDSLAAMIGTVINLFFHTHYRQLYTDKTI